MRKIRQTPSQQELMDAYEYTPETGIFIRRKSFKRWKEGSIAGTLAGGYISINIVGTVFRAHRLAWTYMTGDQPPPIVDHINGITTDNRWENLRAADPSQSTTNRKRQKNCSSNLKGAHKHGSKWRARVKFRGKVIDLGVFGSPEEAHAAYCAVAKVIHANFFRPQA